MFRWGRFDRGVDVALRRLFEALQAAGSESSFRFSDLGLQHQLSQQVRRLVRPVIDERMEASLREGVAIYKRLLDEFGVDRSIMPLTAVALVRRCLNRRPNFLDPPAGTPYTYPPEQGVPRSDAPPDGIVVDRQLLARAQHFLRGSHEIYGADAASAGLNRRDLVLDRVGVDGSHIPRYAVYLDHLAESVVVAVRGTASLRDAFMTVVGEPAPALGGRGLSHKGIFRAAEEMLPGVMDAVVRAAAEYPSYRIVTTGHSLGGGTALLLTLLLRDQRRVWETRLPTDALARMECFAFAPPPIWSAPDALASADTQNMYSFCHNTDMIPRASLHSLQVLTSRYFYVNSIDADETTKLAALLGSDGTAAVDEVLAKVDDALVRSREDLRRGAVRYPDGRSVEFAENLYIPGRVFHLYPADTAWQKSAVQAPAVAPAASADGAPGVEATKAIAGGAAASELGRSMEPSAADPGDKLQSDAKSQARVREQGSTASSSSIYEASETTAVLDPAGAAMAVPDPIDHYRIQELGAALLAEAPIIESDYFAMDHTTAAYINAFQKLELPTPLERGGTTSTLTDGEWWVVRVARRMYE